MDHDGDDEGGSVGHKLKEEAHRSKIMVMVMAIMKALMLITMVLMCIDEGQIASQCTGNTAARSDAWPSTLSAQRSVALCSSCCHHAVTFRQPQVVARGPYLFPPTLVNSVAFHSL